MYAYMIWTRGLRDTIRYHERKISCGDARLIYASNFLREPEELNFDRIHLRFQNLLSLNERTKAKIFHPSLNFHPDDGPKLSAPILREISDAFMEKIGFKGQPYLVYRHFDAGHPHVHIVAPAIKPDGHRVLGAYINSKEYRRFIMDLENTYGLVSSQSRINRERKIDHTLPRKVIYGEELKPAIEHVLAFVLKDYHFTSLKAFNAVLREYNIRAEHVRSKDKLIAYQGLMYRVLGPGGEEVGRPIRASQLYGKPTLSTLEKKFRENQIFRDLDRSSVISRLDRAISRHYPSMQHLFSALEETRIVTLVCHNNRGQVYDFTYVDHDDRCAFTEADLGEKYSATQLMANFGTEPGSKMFAEYPREYQSRPPEGPEVSKAVTRTQLPRLSVASELPENSPLAQIFAQLRKGVAYESEQERHRSRRLSRSF